MKRSCSLSWSLLFSVRTNRARLLKTVTLIYEFPYSVGCPLGFENISIDLHFGFLQRFTVKASRGSISLHLFDRQLTQRNKEFVDVFDKKVHSDFVTRCFWRKVTFRDQTYLSLWFLLISFWSSGQYVKVNTVKTRNIECRENNLLMWISNLIQTKTEHSKGRLN